MKRHIFADLLGLAGLAILLQEPEPSVLLALLGLIVILSVTMYLLLDWLTRRFDTPPSPPGLRSAPTPADFAARRRFAATGVVLLQDHTWEGTRVDSMGQAWPARMQGWTSVWAGRHRVVDGRGHALDFVLHPGEVYVRRLVPEAGVWLPQHPENEADMRRLAEAGPFGHWAELLVDYLQLAGTRPAVPPEDRVWRDPMVRWAEAAEHGRDLHRLRAEADALGQALIGLPLHVQTLRGMSNLLVHRASRLARHSTTRGLFLLDLGLRVLPDDPLLLVGRAGLLREVGLPEEALHSVDTALHREHVLRPDGVSRAQTLKAQILIGLQRYREARELIRAVLQVRPNDATALQVSADLSRREAD